jgi:hypothetical protein
MQPDPLGVRTDDLAALCRRCADFADEWLQLSASPDATVTSPGRASYDRWLSELFLIADTAAADQHDWEAKRRLLTALSWMPDTDDAVVSLTKSLVDDCGRFQPLDRSPGWSLPAWCGTVGSFFRLATDRSKDNRSQH